MKPRRASHPLARKPVETLLKEMHGGERLHRVLGPVALTALGVGATIGAGIFVLTGQAARNDAGPSLILSFLLAAVGCGFAALCYSELASMVPVAGSAYTYAYATLGEMVAWIIGWDLILEYAIASSAVAVGWSKYLSALCRNQFGVTLDPRWLNSPWDFDLDSETFVWNQVPVTLGDGSTHLMQAWINLPAFLIILLITAILVVGIRESARLNAALVVLNVGVILMVITLGSRHVDPANWHPFLHKDHGWAGVARGAAHIFFAYIGFDSISTHSEEAKNPRRDLAIGILASLLICTVLYVAMTAVLTGMVPSTEINTDAPIAAAFERVGGGWTSALITTAILCGITSSLLVAMLSQPRILLAMARDGMLPMSVFGAIHPRFLTPWKSTILIGVVVAVISAVAPLGFLADLVSVGTLFAFVVVCLSVWILRHRSPEVERPFRVPALPVVAGLGITFNGGLMLSLGRENWIRLFVWLALGMVIYLGYSRYHSRLAVAEVGPEV